jgi:DNA-binding NtrC family response regulator
VSARRHKLEIVWVFTHAGTRYAAPTTEANPEMTFHGKQLRISVVDDEILIASSLATVLYNQGFDASFFTEPLQALQSARYYAPDLLISEVSMPVLSGIDLAIQVQKHCPNCKVLLFSGQPDIVGLLETSRANGHAFEVLPKPIHPTALLRQIWTTLGLASLPEYAPSSSCGSTMEVAPYSHP